MRKFEETVYCDICGTVITNLFNRRWIKTGGNGVGFLISHEDVCLECYKTVNNCLDKLKGTFKYE